MKKQLRATLTPGVLLDGRYEVVKLLGSGTVGTALHVLDRELEGQSLVVKVMHPHLASDPSLVKRFCAEALLTRQLSHPNIIRVYDVISSESAHFITMEYIRGCSLDELLQGCSGGRLPFEEAIFILQQILSGLVAAHSNEVIHRDLKPSNIIVDRTGGVKILDFGLAKSVEGDLGLTRTGELIGTPFYMAPEQFGNRSDASGDLYSFSVLAFEMLTGVLPFKSDNVLLLKQLHLTERFPWEKLDEVNVPEWLKSLLQSCAAKSPVDRPAESRLVLAEMRRSHQNTASEVVQQSICRGVRQRERSNHILTGKFRDILRAIWIGVVVIGMIGTLNEKPARLRIVQRVVRVQLMTGISAAPVMWLFGFGDYSELDGAALFKAIDNNDDYAIRMLISVGVDPNLPNSDGVTPLVHALPQSAQVVADLCVNGASANLVDKNGNTALLVSTKLGLKERTSILLRTCNASLGSVDSNGDTALHIAVSLGDISFVDLVLAVAPEKALRIQRTLNHEQVNAMHIAVQKQDSVMLNSLLKGGFDVDMRDGAGWTAAMRLVRSPRTETTEKMLATLIRYGANLAAKDDKGRGVKDHIHETQNPDWNDLLESLPS